MSSRNLPPSNEGRHSRVGALALGVLVLLGACATGAPPGERLATGPSLASTPPESPEASHEETARGNRGEAAAVFVLLPTDFAPVQVGDTEFRAALAKLVPDLPLPVAFSAAPLPSGALEPGTGGSGGQTQQSELGQSYQRYCERRDPQGDCLTLYDDGPTLQADDKRRIALALAVGPALEGVAEEVRAMLNPMQLLATVSFSITAYMALLVAPDPVITKSVATGFTVLLWAYLGSEFFEIIRAYAQLYEEAPRASTFLELHEVGERFGRVIGPNSVRILVTVGTAAAGETAALLSKAPMLPGFDQASRTVGLNARLRLDGAATGAGQIIISTSERTIRAVLPLTALAMVARNGGGKHSASGGGRIPKEGKPLPNGHRAFKSFYEFKDVMGPAGEGKQWHHIVEQRKANVERFGPEAIHNTENVIAVKKEQHEAISAYYSSKSEDTAGMVVREWLRTRSYEEQRAFGLNVLRQFGVLP